MMASSRPSLALFLLLLVSFLLCLVVSAADQYTDFVYAGCSEPKYVAGSPYQFNVDSLLTSLANAASFSSYANFTSSAASSSYPVYGLFQCREDLAISDCDSCIHSALNQLSALCPSAASGGVQLKGCFLRYGNDSFLGKPDTSLLYNKCGPDTPGGGYNSDLLSMRDSALSSLSSGASYRVGAAGYVQSLAQCVGDQTPKECNDCVSAALAKLKGGCGFAVTGDVYLGKCYARYWSNNGVHRSSPDHAQEAGKTLAIIIGVMAAIALIIIFLSFINRSGNGKY